MLLHKRTSSVPAIALIQRQRLPAVLCHFFGRCPISTSTGRKKNVLKKKSRRTKNVGASVDPFVEGMISLITHRKKRRKTHAFLCQLSMFILLTCKVFFKTKVKKKKKKKKKKKIPAAVHKHMHTHQKRGEKTKENMWGQNGLSAKVKGKLCQKTDEGFNLFESL
ncbi:hypothetical protein AOLI_G00264110 [Acnodon oligacanthus]